MAQPTKNRVLKVGLVQDGKLIEENTLAPRATVVVGQDPESMFVVGGSDFPKKHTLLEPEGDGYRICLRPGMAGKLSLDDRIVDIENIGNEEGAEKKGKGYCMRLTPEAKGKVVIGDTNVLFQMVPPVPAVAPMKLPRELRGGVFRAVDLHFVAVLILSVLLHFATIEYMNSIEIPERPPEEVAELPTQLIIPPVVEPPEEPELEDGDLEEGEGTSKGEQKGNAQKPGPKGPDEKGILALITKKDSAGGAVADILSDGLGDDITDALSNLGGVEVARTTELGNRGLGGGGGPGTVGIDGLGNVNRGGTLDTGSKQVKRVSTVRTQSGSVQGKLDRNVIAATVRKYLNGIKACYEYQLKRDPTLKGKIVVRFTIGTDGRVTNVDVVQSTLNDELVKSCVRRRVKRWRFPKPEEGTVTVSYPFIFTAVTG